MKFNYLLLFCLTLLCAGCDHSTREGDVLFIGYRFAKEANAYVSANSTSYMGNGYAASFNASPHVKIWGAMCDLTWIETEDDGSKKTKHVSFPVSNIYEIVWKEN
jgi:hypothetical protein